VSPAGAVKRLALALLLLLRFLFPAGCITLMSYNVENLFDDVDNGTEFKEFDPGRGAWNGEFFKLRIDTIAEVIRKVAAGGPDVLVLQEIENENALRALVGGGLKGMGYDHLALAPKKKLTANVGIASRLPIVRVHTHHVGPWKRNPVRDILEVELQAGENTLHLFDVHWKSKTGGTRETEASRLESSGAIAKRIREILAQDPAADIVVAGDMNENLDEYSRVGRKYQTALIPASARTPSEYARRSLFLAGSARGMDTAGERIVLYDPWFELEEGMRGSYVYQGEWQTMDHFLLSPGLLDSHGFTYRRGSFTVARLPFLLSPNGSPKKWNGLKGQRGYSDHLPLLITLEVGK